MQILNAIKQFEFVLGELAKESLGAPKNLEQVREEVIIKFGTLAGKKPNTQTLDEIFQRFKNILNNNTLDQITKKDWRLFPWVAWMHEGYLAKQDVLWINYEQFLKSVNSRPILTLIHVLLRDYPTDLPGFDRAVKLVKDICAHSNKKLLNIWKERQQTYRIFNFEQDTKFLPKLILQSNMQINETLHKLGLTGELENAKFSERIYNIGINLDYQTEGLNTPLNRILEWSIDKHEFRYLAQKDKLADVLLLNTYLHGNEEGKKKIREFLLQYYKDPRINRGNWQGVSEDAKQVMLKWMVGLVLEQFFTILDKSAVDRMWRYRKEFWNKYYKKNVLSSAWLIVGRDAMQLAPLIIEDQALASLEGYGIQHNQSVLLMEIGDLVIAEWSHNGKCRIWSKNNPSAPPFYTMNYNRSGLTLDSEFEQTHYSSESGLWQSKISEYIYDHTGIQISGFERHQQSPKKFKNRSSKRFKNRSSKKFNDWYKTIKR
jgi:hypothetical protein